MRLSNAAGSNFKIVLRLTRKGKIFLLLENLAAALLRHKASWESWFDTDHHPMLSIWF